MPIIKGNIDIDFYKTESGKSPFREWFRKLDLGARIIIRTRLRRVEFGNFGNCDSVSAGLMEIKFRESPGYRIYYGNIKLAFIMLLNAGIKATQVRDIERAKTYWQDIKMRGAFYEFKKNNWYWFDEL